MINMGKYYNLSIEFLISIFIYFYKETIEQMFNKLYQSKKESVKILF